MSNGTTRQGVNPLRPYYIPPTIGEASVEASNIPGPNAFGGGSGDSAGQKYASKARDIFSDLDYKDYISEPSPSSVNTVKQLVDELMWKYTSVFLAQPFENAKLLLQVRSQDDLGEMAAAAVASPVVSRQSSFKTPLYDDLPSDDEDEEPNYFSSTAPHTPPPTHPRKKRRGSSTTAMESPRMPAKKAELPEHVLNITRPDSVTEVMSQLWQKEGVWGVCKGTNASFIYTVLQSLLENWSRSLLSALLDVPDLGLKNDMDRLVDLASPYPWASLGVATAAAVVTSLVLAPLDLVRTRSIITCTNRAPRRTLAILRSLPSYFCPSSLILPTVLHSLVHPVLALSTPLVLRTKFMIDGELAPGTFSLAKFCSATVALFIKLPLETSLRRCQVAVLKQADYVRAIEHGDSSKTSSPLVKSANISRKRNDSYPDPEEKIASLTMETIVPTGKYDGVFGTMHTIVYEEGSRAIHASAASKGRNGAASKKGKAPKIAEAVYRRGQGVDGLWRGWKVNFWGLVGLWTAAVVGGGGDGEF